MQDVNTEKIAHVAQRVKDMMGKPMQTTDPASVVLLTRVCELLAAIEYELIAARHERLTQNGGIRPAGKLP